MDFEGAINVTTITCDIVNRSRSQESTEWSISSFKGVSGFHTLTDITASEIFLFSGDSIPGAVPNLTYRNQLTILVFSNDLDRVVIFCGSNAFPAQAHFIFRIYRKCYPLLYIIFMVNCDCVQPCRPTQTMQKSHFENPGRYYGCYN